MYKAPILQAIKVPLTEPSAIPGDISKEDGIYNIYPNPATDITNLHFSLSSGSVCILNIYDLKGQKVKNILNGYVNPGLYNIEVDTQSIPVGTYLLVLETNTGISTKKVIIL